MSWFVPSAPGRSTRNTLDPVLEAQFEVLFGAEPPVAVKGAAQKARSDWEQARRLFAGIAAVLDVDAERLENAFAAFEFYGIDRPTFFSITDGRVLARFPGAPIDINPDFGSVFSYPHVTIAVLQSARIKAGVKQNPVHPFVPDHLKKANSELEG